MKVKTGWDNKLELVELTVTTDHSKHLPDHTQFASFFAFSSKKTTIITNTVTNTTLTIQLIQFSSLGQDTAVDKHKHKSVPGNHHLHSCSIFIRLN